MLKKLTAVFLIACMVVTLHAPFSFAAEVGMEESVGTPAVNYTNVGPFLPAVQGATAKRLMAARAVSDDTQQQTDDQEEQDGLVLKKTASEPDENGIYTLSLEAYATGEKIISTEQKDVPTDIVLVLDQSGSMKEHFGYKYTSYGNQKNSYYNDSARKDNLWIKDGDSYVQVTVEKSDSKYNSKYTYTYILTNGDSKTITSTGKNTDPSDNGLETLYSRAIDTSTPTKIYSLKTAVKNFADSVYAKAKGSDGKLGTKDDINHRIAVVGFGSADLGNAGVYTNTELLIGGDEHGYAEAPDYYTQAFQDMDDENEDGYKAVIASKDKLTANGGTYVNLGMEMANGILEANPVASGTKRNRVVIVFTDGAPGYDGTWKGSLYGNSGDAKAVAMEW